MSRRLIILPRGKLLNGLVTQQKVLRAAVALFLENGYTKTTTGEIAKAAGIGQSSFFHVFPSIPTATVRRPTDTTARKLFTFPRT